jgi:hypothetical protein
MKIYVLTFRPHDQRERILKFLDTLPEVINWRASAGAIFIVSDSSADDISKKIHAEFSSLTHVLARIQTGNTHDLQGWADPKTWEIIKHPGPPVAESGELSKKKA